MKYVFGSAVVAAAMSLLGGSAIAADASQNGLTGLYVGVDGGFGWAFADHLPGSGSVTGANDLNLSGGLLGAHIGYDAQLMSGVVLGARLGFDAGSISGSCISPDCHPSQAPSTRHTINSVLTAVGKLGFTSGNVMPYVVGGVAIADATRNTAYNSQSFSNSHTGFVVGAGVDWRFAPTWSVGAEYQYMDLGTKRYAFTSGNQPIVHLTTSILKVNINKHF
jgi:outer membrane immunogenic protein